MKKRYSVIIIAIFILCTIFLYFFNLKKVTNNTANTKDEIFEITNNNINSQINGNNEIINSDELIIQAHELYKQGKYEDALIIVKNVLNIEKSYKIYMSLYSVYLALKDYSEAEKAIQESLKMNDKIPLIWIEYISLERFYIKNNIENILSIYEKALFATKNDIDIVTNYASYLEEVGKNIEAIEQFKIAIKLNPNNKFVYQNEIDRLKTL